MAHRHQEEVFSDAEEEPWAPLALQGPRGAAVEAAQGLDASVGRPIARGNPFARSTLTRLKKQAPAAWSGRGQAFRGQQGAARRQDEDFFEPEPRAAEVANAPEPAAAPRAAEEQRPESSSVASAGHPPQAGAAFIGRIALPQSWDLRRTGPPEERAQPAPQRQRQQQQDAAVEPQQPPPQQQQHRPQQQQAAAAVATAARPAAPGPSESSAAAAGHSLALRAGAPFGRSLAPERSMNRTADGLNVICLKKSTADASELGSEGPAGGSQKSVNRGWGNNFVRIDMKKGRGSTKYKSSRHSKPRRGGRGGGGRGRWKESRMRQAGDGSEFMEGWKGSASKCFKCGGKGHWAKDCTEQLAGMADAAGSSDDEAPGPSGAQAALLGGGSMGGGRLPSATAPQLASHALAAGAASEERGPDPAEEYADILASPTEENLTILLQQVFGFPSFRGLQLETIQRVLRGEACLSIMPTGMGKSLCYQLPSLLLPGLTLVVSPLIALMRDQCASAPPQLRPAMLWSGQERGEAVRVLQDVKSGNIKLLFVSPERLNNPHLLDVLRPNMPLAMVVIDEAHCVAEWGHSFRPAYFRLGAVLQAGLSSRSILALTATATQATEAAICTVLRIAPDQVVRDSVVRDNLRLHAIRRKEAGGHAIRDTIAQLFQSGDLQGVRAGIVYCAFKEDTNQIAKALNAKGVKAKSYHAGKDFRERIAIEQDFRQGRIRVVCATVAFGMGIDIRDVGAVIHATMPRSLEEYVQQVGRAGRDGQEARCYAFLDDREFVRLRSLAYSDQLDKEAVLAFLEEVFAAGAAASSTVRAAAPAKSAARKRKAAEEEELSACASQAPDEAGKPAGGPAQLRFQVLPLQKLSAVLDMREDSMETVLSYLEADQGAYVRMLPSAPMSVKVSFYAVPAEQMALSYPLIQTLLQVSSHPRNGIYTVNTARLATAAQQPPGAVLQELRQMAHDSLIGFEFPREEGAAYEVLRAPKALPALADDLYRRLSASQTCQVSRLDTSYRALAAAAQHAQHAPSHEAALREAITAYFDAPAIDAAAGPQLDTSMLPLKATQPTLLQAVRTADRRNREQDGPPLTARALARILHGVSSPAFPADPWGKRMYGFWGSLATSDFAAVLKAAEIVCRGSVKENSGTVN